MFDNALLHSVGNFEMQHVTFKNNVPSTDVQHVQVLMLVDSQYLMSAAIMLIYKTMSVIMKGPFHSTRL